MWNVLCVKIMCTFNTQCMTLDILGPRLFFSSHSGRGCSWTNGCLKPCNVIAWPTTSVSLLSLSFDCKRWRSLDQARLDWRYDQYIWKYLGVFSSQRLFCSRRPHLHSRSVSTLFRCHVDPTGEQKQELYSMRNVQPPFSLNFSSFLQVKSWMVCLRK